MDSQTETIKPDIRETLELGLPYIEPSPLSSELHEHIHTSATPTLDTSTVHHPQDCPSAPASLVDISTTL